MVAYFSKELEWIGPIAPISQIGSPVLLTWIGAVRIVELPQSAKP